MSSAKSGDAAGLTNVNLELGELLDSAGGLEDALEVIVLHRGMGHQQRKGIDRVLGRALGLAGEPAHRGRDLVEVLSHDLRV